MVEGTPGVLVTGFPRLLSLSLIEFLLLDPNWVIYVLVPPKHENEYASFCVHLGEENMSRVRQLSGDPSHMDFGLSGVEYMELCSAIHIIHHGVSAAFSVSPSEADFVHLKSVEELFEFASHCTHLRKIAFYSTALVAGTSGFVSENDLQLETSFRSVNLAARVRAEHLARKAMDRFPICIVRPALALGDSRSGRIDPESMGYHLLTFLLTAPNEILNSIVRTNGERTLHFVPMDYVAQAGIAFANDPRASGKTFHLVHPSPYTVKKVIELVRKERPGQALKLYIPKTLAESFFYRRKNEGFSEAKRVLLQLFSDDVTYMTKSSDELLEGASIFCPALETYVDSLVQRVDEMLQEQS